MSLTLLQKMTWNHIRAQARLFKGCIEGDLDKVVDALKHGADVNKPYHVPGAEPMWDGNEKNATPLMLACEYEHDDLIPFLMEHGANPNCQGNTYLGSPMVELAKKGKVEILEFCHQFGGDEYPEKKSFSAFEQSDNLGMVSIGDIIAVHYPEKVSEWKHYLWELQTQTDRENLENLLPENSKESISQKQRI